MAAGRELKNKIRSIKNTKKITRTMEMISTAKSRVCQKRAEAVKPYGDKLAAMLRDLGRSAPGGEQGEFPLLRRPEKIAREAIIVITANRGLCGGYNTNVLKLAERRIDRLVAAGTEVETYMIGKKGAARFRYAKRPVAAALTNFDDKPTYEQAEELIEPLLDRFSKGEIDAVTVVLTRYESAARQTPAERELLPLADPAAALSGDAKGDKGASPEKDNSRPREFILEPDAATILGRLLPVSLKTRLFQSLVEAAVCEQIARRVAMKNATDNAEEMVKSYTQIYNRTRQANITQEILEVIGGAQK